MVDQNACSRRGKLGQSCTRAIDGAHQVDLKHALKRLGWDVQEGPEGVYARVVEPDVDAPERLDGLVGQSPDLSFVCDISLQADNVGPCLSAGAHGVVQLWLSAGAQREVGAAAGEGKCRSLADAARGSGDHRNHVMNAYRHAFSEEG